MKIPLSRGSRVSALAAVLIVLLGSFIVSEAYGIYEVQQEWSIQNIFSKTAFAISENTQDSSCSGNTSHALYRGAPLSFEASIEVISFPDYSSSSPCSLTTTVYVNIVFLVLDLVILFCVFRFAIFLRDHLVRKTKNLSNVTPVRSKAIGSSVAIAAIAITALGLLVLIKTSTHDNPIASPSAIYSAITSTSFPFDIDGNCPTGPTAVPFYAQIQYRNDNYRGIPFPYVIEVENTDAICNPPGKKIYFNIFCLLLDVGVFYFVIRLILFLKEYIVRKRTH